MAPAPVDPPLLESSSSDWNSSARFRFSGLRSVRWRIGLGVLPQSPSVTVDSFRRVTADSRRRYATLRRRLTIDPYPLKDNMNAPDLSMDNPLSQNPDSKWGRYFRSAELEKMVDQDLSRLYPEHGCYFQTPACQAMLRRILLTWCLRHPEYGYRQGMHELLAPLLYALQADVQHLSEVRKKCEESFSDDFDQMHFPDNDLVTNYRMTRAANWVAGIETDYDVQESESEPCCLDPLDPETRDIFLLCDAYGAEGELGIILSERFMEHDAYCMFDGLMNGGCGVVAMADFYSHLQATGSDTGLPPVIEASSALYHLLSIVDSSLHSHLVELGVEPQYFGLRWLRVLFGREFSLEDLLVIWDEIFLSSNDLVVENDSCYSFKILCSPRGAFISAMAVSMLLHLRSSLLATEYATSCLQRLLNFPQKIDLKKLMDKAKSFQVLALESIISSSSDGCSERNNMAVRRGYTLPSGSVSPNTPLYQVPDSYWEQKWRVLNKEEPLHEGEKNRPVTKGIIEQKLIERLGLSRTESDPSPILNFSGNNEARLSLRRSLVNEFSQGINSKTDLGKGEYDGTTNMSDSKESISVEGDEGKEFTEEVVDQNAIESASDGIEDTSLSGGENSVYSTVTSPSPVHNEEGNDSDKSSLTSNSSAADNDEINPLNQSCSNSINDDTSPQGTDDIGTSCSAVKPGPSTNNAEKQGATVQEQKPRSSKFQWFWKFARGLNEGNPEKGGSEPQQSSVVRKMHRDISSCTNSDGACKTFAITGRTEVVDKKMITTMKNLGQSLLENIQVIESVFQQDRSQTGTRDMVPNNILAGKRQAKAMAALKELRKISNLISEM